MSEMTMEQKLERLYVCRALKKVVADAEDDVRRECNEEIVRSYLDDGCRLRDARVNDRKVGTYSVSVTEEKRVEYPVITDTPAFAAWMADNPEVCTQFAMAESVRLVDFALAKTGELPDGVDIQADIKPRKLTPRLTVDPEKVADALKGGLPGAVAGLMEGGQNG